MTYQLSVLKCAHHKEFLIKSVWSSATVTLVFNSVTLLLFVSSHRWIVLVRTPLPRPQRRLFVSDEFEPAAQWTCFIVHGHLRQRNEYYTGFQTMNQGLGLMELKPTEESVLSNTLPPWGDSPCWSNLGPPFPLPLTSHTDNDYQFGANKSLSVVVYLQTPSSKNKSSE